jgi:hypothetical protein
MVKPNYFPLVRQYNMVENQSFWKTENPPKKAISMTLFDPLSLLLNNNRFIYSYRQGDYLQTLACFVEESWKIKSIAAEFLKNQAEFRK